jgi:hypothetical protein
MDCVPWEEVEKLEPITETQIADIRRYRDGSDQ